MSDFLDLMLEGDAPQARTVTYTDSAGKTQSGVVHFRRITAGERQKLLVGQKYVMNKDGEASNVRTEIDLSLNEAQRHMLVAFSVCRENGSQVFKNAAEVARLDAVKVNALYEAATSLSDGEGEAGKG